MTEKEMLYGTGEKVPTGQDVIVKTFGHQPPRSRCETVENPDHPGTWIRLPYPPAGGGVTVGLAPPKRWLDVAVDQSYKSPCQSKRGAVMWSFASQELGKGHNNQPKPFRCDGSDQCRLTCGKTAVHAEQAALLSSNWAGGLDGLEVQMIHIKTKGGNLVAGGPPSCLDCSKLILHSGVRFMWLYQTTLNVVDGKFQVGKGWFCYTAARFHQETLLNNSMQSIAPAGVQK